MTNSLKRKSILFAGLALLVPVLAIPQSSPPSHLIKLELEGTGTNGASFASGGSATFTVKGQDVGRGTLTFMATNGTVIGSNAVGSACLVESGSAMLTASDSSTISMSHLGMSCGDNVSNFVTWNTTYFITGGTGRYSGATGVGNLVVSDSGPGFCCGTGAVLVHVDGNANILNQFDQ